MDLRGDRKRTFPETTLTLKKFAMTRASSPAREGAHHGGQAVRSPDCRDHSSPLHPIHLLHCTSTSLASAILK